MTKKTVHKAQIYHNGEKIGTYTAVTYVTMTQQEKNIRLAAMTVIAFIAALIIQAMI